jgi:mannose-6-phosphate isomerase
MNYLKEENVSNSVVNCPYFTTNFIPDPELTTVTMEIALPFTCVAGAFEMGTIGILSIR